MGDQWELDAEDQMGDTVCICGKVVFVFLLVFALLGDTVCICDKVVFVLLGDPVRNRDWFLFVFVFALMWYTVSIYGKVPILIPSFVPRDVPLLHPTSVQLQVYEEGHFMIQCDICRDWLHGECVRVTFVSLNPDHESFVCPC